MYPLKAIIIMSILSMCWWRKNIIMLLLSLELLLLSMFITIPFLSQPNPSISLLMMLTLMVSGSSLGLSLLVAFSRSHKSSKSIFIWTLLTFVKNLNPIIIIITIYI